jgi:hypothetical protein
LHDNLSVTYLKPHADLLSIQISIMRISQLFLSLGASVVCVAGITNSSYTVADSYDATNFFSKFSFYTGQDPTGGFVDYQGEAAANQSGLAGYSNGAIYLGVDYKTVNPTSGRSSVRVTSNKAYTKGLIIADIAHMPASTCGTWPAFWTFGPNWPNSGEIDIIEGVNMQTSNSITLHTSEGCSLDGSGSVTSSVLASTDCTGNNGCSFKTINPLNYGTGFNAAGGGVYAMDWTSSAIAIYFFPRANIPADITSGSPNPSSWGLPLARFSGSGCDIDSHFMNQNIVFDTTFCGQVSSTCCTLSQYMILTNFYSGLAKSGQTAHVQLWLPPAMLTSARTLLRSPRRTGWSTP